MSRTSLRSKLVAAALLGTAALAAPLLAQTDRMDFAQAFPGSDGPDIGSSEIVVDSSDGGRYDQIKTEKIDLWFRLTLNKLANIEPLIPFEKQHAVNEINRVEISAEGVTIQAAGANYSAHRYKLSFPYAHPHSGSVANQRNSPIETCNQRLDSLSGAAREEFRDKGARIELASAYPARARGFIEFRRRIGPNAGEMAVVKTHDDHIRARVTVVCRALNAPKPRTQTNTQGVDPKPGKRLEPTISEAELRIEPAQFVTVAGQVCPSQLRLHGRVQAIRKFTGKAVIFGAGYFSPVTQLNYPAGGNRNFSAVYPLRWDKVGGLAGGPSGALKSQTVSLTMNVTTADNAVLRRVEETVTVTCKRAAEAAVLDLGGTGRLAVKPKEGDPDQPVVLAGMWNAPDAGEPRPVRVKRTHGAVYFVKRSDNNTPLEGIDASIRLVDRRGPGGATRLFVRNAGTEAGAMCRVYAKRDVYKGWIDIGSTQLQTGRTSTVEFSGALPRDPKLTFAIDCAGEPDDRLDDNVATLP